MADDSLLALSNTLIAGRYAVDTSQTVRGASPWRFRGMRRRAPGI